MMKRLLFLLCTAICLPAIISCSDTDGLEDHTYDRWQERNDSAFAAVYARAQHEIAQGSSKWRIFKSYATTLAATPENSIVVRIDRQGTGSGCPLYTDSVRVNYQGLLLTGKQFDHSGLFKDYESIFSPTLCSPAALLVKNTVEGFTTALQQMHIGDLWHVYIPWQLGYGPAATTAIPAHSMLQFDVELKQYARTGNPLPVWK